MLHYSLHQQVVRDVFAKCGYEVFLKVRSSVQIGKGPKNPDERSWHLWVRQVDGLDIEIGQGDTEKDMWSDAYSLVLTATAERWRQLTKKPGDEKVGFTILVPTFDEFGNEVSP